MKIYFVEKEKILKMIQDYEDTIDFIDRIDAYILNKLNSDIEKYELSPSFKQYDDYKDFIIQSLVGKKTKLYHIKKDIEIELQKIKNIKFWLSSKYDKILTRKIKLAVEVISSCKEVIKISESMILKTKRVYSEIDPYGEENWNE